MKPLVSVVVCVRNGETTVRSCIESLLNQTFKEYEVVIVDDASTDRTAEIIKGFRDQRIKYLKNKDWSGLVKSRNTGLKNADGKYFFFTDADMTVYENWIEEGLSGFTSNYVGVEGKIIYVSEDYQPTFSDVVMENRNGQQFMTGNIAYRKDIIETVGYFNEKISYLHDRELGLRIIKHGKVRFNRNMIAIHPKVTLTPKKLIASANRIEERPYLFKKFGDKALVSWHIVNPFNLAKIFFPGLIMASLFWNKFRTKEDYNLLPYSYVYAVLERMHIWKASTRERVFLI